VNPVEAHFVAGELTHALMKGSLKALDLLRDPRAYLHTPIVDAGSGEPGEFKLRARAVPVLADPLRAAIQDAVEKASGWRPPADWHFFTSDVESAAFHEYDSKLDVHHVKRWTPERGFESSTRTIET
jgi:hypothetical protein